jgi:virulence-associated protein VapD
MIKLYEGFFNTCNRFDKFVQEEKWKKVKDFSEFKNFIDNEYQFWKRVLTMLPPEQRLLKEFDWFTQCYKQIRNNMKDEQINRKMRWIAKSENKKETV